MPRLRSTPRLKNDAAPEKKTALPDATHCNAAKRSQVGLSKSGHGAAQQWTEENAHLDIDNGESMDGMVDVWMHGWMRICMSEWMSE